MRRPDYDRRVAITGLGVISPIGNDIPTVWDNLSHGVSGLAELTRFPVDRYEHKWGGEVKDFTASDWMDPKHARRTELSVHYGVAAAKLRTTARTSGLRSSAHWVSTTSAAASISARRTPR